MRGLAAAAALAATAAVAGAGKAELDAMMSNLEGKVLKPPAVESLMRAPAVHQ
jgi:hypothetical protein